MPRQFKTLTDLLPSQRWAADTRPRPDAESSETKIPQAKRLFLDFARQICPGFTVRPDYRQAYADVVRWCLGIPGTLHPGRGLWIWGDVGCGKSTLAEIIAAFWPSVSQSQYMWRISNAVDVASIFEADGLEALKTFIDWRLQIFDEVGREPIPAYHYGSQQNIFEHILHRRYDRRSRCLTIVTTNLTPEQIPEYYGDYIADRCRQSFTFLPLRGASFR